MPVNNVIPINLNVFQLRKVHPQTKHLEIYLITLYLSSQIYMYVTICTCIFSFRDYQVITLYIHGHVLHYWVTMCIHRERGLLARKC